MSQTIYDLNVKRIDGTPTTLKDFAGQVMLVVNVASKCGLTPQYEGLEALHEKFAARGLQVLGFPANEFGAQEPGSNADIQTFCRSNFGVKFPMFEKIVVKGQGMHPLYQHLTQAQPKAQGDANSPFQKKLAEHGMKPDANGSIQWNFEKFLVNREGRVVARFAPDVAPDDAKLTQAIQSALDS
jgi:glutathione peroxidase